MTSVTVPLSILRWHKEIEAVIARSKKVEIFRALHRKDCFIVPNPWDIAGARMMMSLGLKHWRRRPPASLAAKAGLAGPFD
jgi:2-methylisocitrate lyase-like PEP mutase family enzyme